MSQHEAVLSEDTRILRLHANLPRVDRPAEFADDLCFTPELVEAFVKAYTAPEDFVVDPFSGFGTTVRTAVSLGRSALGLEIDADRVAYSRRSLPDPAAVQQADVRTYDWSRLPRFTLALASPPYMTREGHDQNPLSGYKTLDGEYAQYLRDLQSIYRGLAARAAGPDSRIVVNVANLRTTPLAWDVGAALAEVLSFDREIVLDWDAPQSWFTQDYCLVFRPTD